LGKRGAAVSQQQKREEISSKSNEKKSLAKLGEGGIFKIGKRRTVRGEKSLGGRRKTTSFLREANETVKPRQRGKKKKALTSSPFIRGKKRDREGKKKKKWIYFFFGGKKKNPCKVERGNFT